jgi:hypothetical protein
MSDDAARRRRAPFGSPRRVTTIVAIVAVLGAALVAGSASRDPAADAALPDEAVEQPPSGVRSSAWFCPGGIPGDGGPAGETVYVTNLSARDASVKVTALSRSRAPVGRQVGVAARSTVAVPVADISAAPDAALVLEPFADGLVVEQALGAPGRDDLAMGPCATESSPTWYFAAGSTASGSEQWLSLLNPYATDAVVDITLVTDEGRRQPDALRGLPVLARSRVSVRVNDHADRRQWVAVVVESRDGARVVAQQTVVHNDVGGRIGVSSTLGAPAPATRFTFATGARREGSARTLFVLNPGPVPVPVDVQLAAAGTTPMTITVPAGSLEVLNMNALVPVGTTYSVVVQSAADFDRAGASSREGGIVVEDWENFRVEEGPRSFFGVAGGIGGLDPATEWSFARSRLSAEVRGSLMVYNPGESATEVRVTFVGGGTVETPDDAVFEVQGASRGTLRLDSIFEEDAGLIVTSDQPVYVERFLARGEAATRAAGIPTRS